MTAPELASPALHLPPHPRDAHVEAADALLRRLAVAFPAAGLGITGSVAAGTHGPASDVDLVMVDGSFRRDMQFATVSRGVRCAIVSLRPGLGAERERRWMLQSAGDMHIVSMVRSAFVARDPAGVLGEMQRTVARLDAERITRRDELVALRHADALAAIRALHGGTADSDERLQLRLFSAVVDGWFLSRGLMMETRHATERMLGTIAAHDPALAALLHRAIPLTHAAMAPLLRAADHVFGAQPPDSSQDGTLG